MKSMLRSALSASAMLLVLFTGCRSHDKPAAKDDGFQTSGSREADQRAEQRITKEEQLRGEATGASSGKAKATLYARLGGQEGVDKIVSDFVDRAIADPRANWERKGVKRGGVLGVGGSSAEWKPTPENLEQLKRHLAQFIAVATGGPTQYDGKTMTKVHSGMKITNAEFDASIGALKATLDALEIAVDEQRELLAVFESTRPQIAEKR